MVEVDGLAKENLKTKYYVKRVFLLYFVTSNFNGEVKLLKTSSISLIRNKIPPQRQHECMLHKRTFFLSCYRDSNHLVGCFIANNSDSIEPIVKCSWFKGS
jgi:hypothetical protein